MFAWPRAAIAVTLMLLAASGVPMPADQAKNIGLADVEQPLTTGGVIALYPRAVDAQMLAIPGSELPDYLHLTLVYFGDDVSDVADSKRSQILEDLTATYSRPIGAYVFGHAIFNPNDKNSHRGVVYMIGDSPDLAPLRQRALEASEQRFPVPAQHEPWIPHITAAYGPSDAVLTYTGPVVFDRIGLSSASHTTYVTLGDR